MTRVFRINSRLRAPKLARNNPRATQKELTASKSFSYLQPYSGNACRRLTHEMSASPSHTLPCCPLCSTLVTLYRPSWRYARHTSARKGENCYLWVGCRHACEVGSASQVYGPEEWPAVEDQWTRYADELFQIRTLKWSETERTKFRRALDGHHVFIATSKELAELEAEGPIEAPKRMGDLI